MHQIIQRPHSCWWSFSILWTNIVFVGILHAVHIFWLVLSTHLLHLKILMPMYRRQKNQLANQLHIGNHMITLSTHLHVSDIIFTGPGLRKATLAHQLLFESHYRYRHQAHPSHHPGSVKEQPVDPQCCYLGIVIPAATDITWTVTSLDHHWQYKLWASPTVPQFVTRRQIYRPPFPFA